MEGNTWILGDNYNQGYGIIYCDVEQGRFDILTTNDIHQTYFFNESWLPIQLSFEINEYDMIRMIHIV